MASTLSNMGTRGPSEEMKESKEVRRAFCGLCDWASFIPCVRDVRGRISIPEYTSEEYFSFFSKYDPDYLPSNPDCRVITTQCLPSLQGKWDSYSTASLFPSPPCPSHSTTGPSAAPWCESFGCGPLLGLPKGAFWCSSWEGDHPPMQLGVGGVRDRDPNPTVNPSHLQPPCPCSVLLDNRESSSLFCLS